MQHAINAHKKYFHCNPPALQLQPIIEPEKTEQRNTSLLIKDTTADELRDCSEKPTDTPLWRGEDLQRKALTTAEKGFAS